MPVPTQTVQHVATLKREMRAPIVIGLIKLSLLQQIPKMIVTILCVTCAPWRTIGLNRMITQNEYVVSVRITSNSSLVAIKFMSRDFADVSSRIVERVPRGKAVTMMTTMTTMTNKEFVISLFFKFKESAFTEIFQMP